MKFPIMKLSWHEDTIATENVQMDHEDATENVQLDHENTVATENIQIDHENTVVTVNIQIDHESTAETENVHVRSVKRKQDPIQWKKNSSKRLRMEGKPYKGMKKVDGKWDFNVDRAQRISAPRTCSKWCEKSIVKQCNTLTEGDRTVIFTKFWTDMNWDQKKIYVNALVEQDPVKEKTVETSRRNRSYR